MSDEGPEALVGEQVLTPVHPDHKKVLRIRAVIVSLVLLVPGIIGEFAADEVPTGVFLVPWLVFAAIFVWRVPQRRWTHKGYAHDDNRLRVVKGFLFRSDTVVPYGRVQHIDVTQSPLERVYDLSQLVVHTAGSHNASVVLEGLKRETAESLREEIRAHIKRETL